MKRRRTRPRLKPRCSSMCFAATGRANRRVVVERLGLRRRHVRSLSVLECRDGVPHLLHHACFVNIAGFMSHARCKRRARERIRNHVRCAAARCRRAASACNRGRGRARDRFGLADRRWMSDSARRGGRCLSRRAFGGLLCLSYFDSDMLEKCARVGVARIDGKRVLRVAPCASP